MLFSVILYAQKTIPYKTLDSISATIRKLQLSISNKEVLESYSQKNDSGRVIYYTDTTIYNFPEDNFGIVEENHLAYKAIGSKQKGSNNEFYRVSENIDLTNAKSISWRYNNDSTACGVTLKFPNESINGYRLDGDKKINMAFSALSFEYPITNKKSIQTNSLPLLVQLLVKLYHLLSIEKGLLTPEQASKELKDLNSMSPEDFLNNYPNSLFSQRAKNLISQAAKQREQQNNDLANATSNNSLAGEISRLFELKQKGALTEAEFVTAKAKLLATPDTKNTEKVLVAVKPDNHDQPVISFKRAGNDYCAIKAPANSEFIGLYEYPGNEPVFYGTKRVGEPVVQLDATERESGRSGKFQAHGIDPYEIVWWIESDCNGNEEVINGELGDRRILVVKYLTGDGNYPVGSYDRFTLDKFKTGKIVILGEREKVR